MPFALGIVTVLALLTTIAMGIVTWRLVRKERRRTAARLAALAAELGEGPSASAEPATVPADLFQTRSEETGERTRRLVGFGVASVVVVAVVLVVLILPTGRQTELAPAEPHHPIELLALAHEHEEGMLAITGIVRHPGNRPEERQLTVMALALDDTGGVVATGRAPIERDSLAAGTDSTFAVSLSAEDATRYRISFLFEDTTVPHLDRRVTRAGAAGKTES